MKEKFASSTFNDFSDIYELYRSYAGAVYRAKFKYDSKQYVLKERKIPELGKQKDLLSEAKLLAQLQHPNVIRCEGWFRDERRCAVFIVLEYCDGGDLNTVLNYRKSINKHFEEKQIWYIFHQICHGLKHLHENGIVHRDLKAMNIICHRGGRIFKIGDLGVSRQVSEDTVMLKTFYGTPLYLSPELIENRPYNEKTDLWSLGIILYELTSLRLPFRASTLVQLAKVVLKGEYDPIPNQYSSSLDRCITWLLNLDFKKRPNISQLIQYVEKKITQGYHGEDIVISASHGVSTPSLSVDDEKDYLSEDSLERKEHGSEKELGKPVFEDHPPAAAGAGAGRSEPVVRQSYSPQAKGGVSRGASPHRRRKQPIDGAEPHTKNVNTSAIGCRKQDERNDDDHNVAAVVEEDDDPLVTVDMQRVQMLLRRENSQHRKLLQVKNFFVDVKAPAVVAAALPSDQQSKASIINNIRDSIGKIEKLEKCLLQGNMPKSSAVSFGLLSTVKTEESGPMDRVVDSNNGSIAQLQPNKYADNAGGGVKLPFGAARLVSQNIDDDTNRHAYRARPSTALAGPRFELQYHTPGSSSSSSSTSKDEYLDGSDRQRKNRLFPNPILSNEDNRIYEGKAKPQAQLQPPPLPLPSQLPNPQQPEQAYTYHHHHHQSPPLRPKSAGPSYRAVPAVSRSNAAGAGGGGMVNDSEPIISTRHRADSDDNGKARVKEQGLGIGLVGDHAVPSKHSNKDDDGYARDRHPISFSDHMNKGYGLPLPSMAPKFNVAPSLLALSPERAPPEEDDDYLQAPQSHAARKRTSFVKKKFNDGPPEPTKATDGKVKRVQYNIISGV